MHQVTGETALQYLQTTLPIGKVSCSEQVQRVLPTVSRLLRLDLQLPSIPDHQSDQTLHFLQPLRVVPVPTPQHAYETVRNAVGVGCETKGQGECGVCEAVVTKKEVTRVPLDKVPTDGPPVIRPLPQTVLPTEQVPQLLLHAQNMTIPQNLSHQHLFQNIIYRTYST